MLERTTRSYFEDILSKDFTYLEKQDLISLENKRNLRCKLRNSNLKETDDVGRSSDERNMTRKTRTRRPRIPAIQSGYCAVCNIPYNNVEDHIQSKKHLKLIGEDANYIALNGSLNGFLQTSSIPFLNLNGIDAIGVHETSLEDFSPKYKRRSMPRTRATSVVSDRVTKPSPLSPTGSDVTGHHLRSRRNINYMTPPLDDDSLQEKLDLTEKRVIEPVHQEYREYRELRSSTRALAKLTEQISDHHEEVWNSGRPKRACIRQKRVSADERLVSNNKTYYKVEVLSSKLRSNTNQPREADVIKTRQSQLAKREEEEKEKGLIVKFKKLRNSELIQLNNEATNFLFPKKDDESSEEEEEEADADYASATASVTHGNDSSDAEDGEQLSQKFKVEDEASMDSTCSENKRKKKRRTHAEAFIMDNQKYYKFEMPGSRLRYHGSYLPSIMKSPKHGEACLVKKERDDATEEPKEKIGRVNRGARLSLEKYKFSFEKIPRNTAWYNTFQRIDKGEQRYTFFNNHYYWDPFILPYQMPTITPLDPRVCMGQYSQLLKCICDPTSETESIGCSTPECSITTSNTSMYEPEIDEDSKMSVVTVSSTHSIEEPIERKRRGRRPRSLIQASASGKNPRKSPRQHASTLAILSSLIHQRKRRSRNKALNDSNQSLPAIPEEDVSPQQSPQNQRSLQKTKTPLRKFKPKIDYFSMARQIDEELDNAWEDDNLEELELEVEENPIDIGKNKVTVNDVLRLYEEEKSKEDGKSCKRFFNGTPGRKPGRRKKKNKTGWPNKNKRLSKKGQEKEKEEENDDSTIDSMSVNMDSEEEACEEDANSTDSVKKVVSGKGQQNGDQALNNVKDQNGDVDRVEKTDISDKVLTNKVTNRSDFQPYVCVEKLDSDKLLGKQIGTPKRTNRRQRRMPGSPKSPRMLRKPRGRWYRER
ncbi:uncharacterized protein LOC108905031 isoform X2 [Anoplophora glabripennis]|uniref:uncharacterized protein LOC108905031 isoform X2 n=1 Tax=Anoplophora glabripennis TaxID=217634 RepID=UPI00087527FC|nr:uncharacterized protein LOC108905031 isoform X2 [Anoplophora glabripennis]